MSLQHYNFQLFQKRSGATVYSHDHASETSLPKTGALARAQATTGLSGVALGTGVPDTQNVSFQRVSRGDPSSLLFSQNR